ncbi:S9 family peptidase [Reichenbachiella versicolor]|uniref:S9 family peptidase n=1 Tax=Reichenbachiella versicolor TaxID=1821036 RepID=UPI000D6E1049|nr:DPP IV N-terminal domain-containing protein [Reichenbachiella versicolor]
MKQLVFLFLFFTFYTTLAQSPQDSSYLTLDRIFASSEFRQDYQPPVKWIDNGESYIIIEKNKEGQNEMIEYSSSKSTRSIFLSSKQLTPKSKKEALKIEEFYMSDDESKVLIFTNSKRVWRSNTKGDYWVYDLSTNKLSQIGKDFEASSLMFAKFSKDNQFVAYVMDFNIYKEDFKSGKVTQLTTDGTIDIINGTFDWVYEEEFSCRDGFRWSPDATNIAYWQLDASQIGVFNMINNTDSIYSKIVPVQYPKVGRDPSSARIGIVDVNSGKTEWVKLKGSIVQNYIPAIQWINKDQLLIQQLNRKQNHLKVWLYNLSTKSTSLLYEEKEDSWVAIQYPDLSKSRWMGNDLTPVLGGSAVLRLTEDKWRNAYTIDLNTGKTTMVSPGDYDVASVAGNTSKLLYYHASPTSTAQRYLYSVDLKGNKKDQRITPSSYQGVNTYNVSPNGKYAFHSHTSGLEAKTVRLISLPSHKTIRKVITNEEFTEKLSKQTLPTVELISVTTEDGTVVDGRLIKPVNFNESTKYPVIFNVYGEPAGAKATDTFVGMWNIFLAQQGYVVIAIDPRGTPCLKGSDWRKSVYRQIGRLNIRDLGLAAKEIIKAPYIDTQRVGVWGWSGGGSSTLNLLFQYPYIFQAGVSVAPLTDARTYDNIYQERYMGLPQENMDDYVLGAPITHAKNLEGKLLLIHGTGDDNVHYQNAEMLVNELILQNKQFEMMAYPNRSHGIYEGENTRRHLYTLIFNFFERNMQ